MMTNKHRGANKTGEFILDTHLHDSLPDDLQKANDIFMLQIRAAQVLGEVCNFTDRHASCSKDCLESTFWGLEGKLRQLSTIAIQSSTETKDMPCITLPITFM